MAKTDYTPGERERYQRETRERMNRYVEELAERWEQDPVELAEYLAMQSRFPTYSPRNTMLIYAQNPHAHFVASYSFYEKLGYHIRKGQHGMRIMVPQTATFYRLRPDGEWKRLTDATEETRRLVQAGAIESREQVHFRPGVVFELSQTTCPREAYPKLVGLGYDSTQHAQIYEAVKCYAGTLGMPVKERDLGSPDLRGRYCPDGRIEINQLLGDTQRLSTLLHELSHGLLEHAGQTYSLARKEFEADTLSILFAAAFELEITSVRRSHLANNYRAFRTEWAEDETIAKVMKPVTALYDKHIVPLKEQVEQALSPVQEASVPERKIAEETKQPRRISPPSENYRLLQEMFPQVMDGTYRYMRLEAAGMEPLSLKWIDHDALAIMHTYVQNGDLMRDPEMTVRVDTKSKTVQPLTYQLDSLGIYREAGEGAGDLPLRRHLNGELLQWLRNIREQGYVPVRAVQSIQGEDVEMDLRDIGHVDEKVSVTIDTEGLKVKGHIGTWHSIDSRKLDGHIYFLMEHDEYGDEAACVVVDDTGQLVVEDVCNGWDEVLALLEPYPMEPAP